MLYYICYANVNKSYYKKKNKFWLEQKLFHLSIFSVYVPLLIYLVIVGFN